MFSCFIVSHIDFSALLVSVYWLEDCHHSLVCRWHVVTPALAMAGSEWIGWVPEVSLLAHLFGGVGSWPGYHQPNVKNSGLYLVILLAFTEICDQWLTCPSPYAYLIESNAECRPYRPWIPCCSRPAHHWDGTWALGYSRLKTLLFSSRKGKPALGYGRSWRRGLAVPSV